MQIYEFNQINKSIHYLHGMLNKSCPPLRGEFNHSAQPFATRRA